MYTINSLGIRGPEYPAPSSEILRILAMGGSTTYGVNNLDGTTWPALLEYPFEELAWKIIQEDKNNKSPKYWHGTHGNTPDREAIRKNWEKIKEQAKKRAK